VVGERCECDKEHAFGEVVDQIGGGLEREPCLAGAAGSGEREQTGVVAPEPLGDESELEATSDLPLLRPSGTVARVGGLRRKNRLRAPSPAARGRDGRSEKPAPDEPSAELRGSRASSL
jgi:hypothetical protein